MSKIRIAVFFGGQSGEYGVSLKSAYSVLTALDRERYEIIPIGITEEGAWFVYNGNYRAVRDDEWTKDHDHLLPALISHSRPDGGILTFYGHDAKLIKIDAAFPVLHGKYGEDGTVQGLSELAGIPVIGCGTLSSALCMDKHRAHRLAAAEGISVPKAIVINKNELRNLSDINITPPFFIKPLRAGSSLGITRVTNLNQFRSAAENALLYDDEIIVERAVKGFETGCAVMGGYELITGRPDEIELSHGFFDFEEKYTLKTSEIHCPARVTPEKEREICDTAKRIYRILGCRGFARVDMFLTPSGKLVFNEVNTIPGLTNHSRFPKMMEAAGIPFPRFLDKLIGLSVGEPITL